MDKFITRLQEVPFRAFNLLTTVFTSPPRELWGLIGLLVCIARIVSFILSRY
jgi:hypothetical protein